MANVKRNRCVDESFLLRSSTVPKTGTLQMKCDITTMKVNKMPPCHEEVVLVFKNL